MKDSRDFPDGEKSAPAGQNARQGANMAWGGRFSSGPAASVVEFTDSQHYDRAMYEEDIKASRAHAEMLGRQGIITADEAASLIGGLGQVLEEIRQGKFEWKQSLEDVHMNIESRLIEIVGDTGKKLHTARSRNDQVGLTFRLFVVKNVTEWQDGCLQMCKSLGRIAANHQNDILPGCTHFQPAQPVSLAQHLLAYASMFRRDYERIGEIIERISVSPLGAAALAGTTYPVDPRFVAEKVGFRDIYSNSMDAVSDRDFVLEALFAASLVMMHLSRLCEEIIIWSNPAFGFVGLPDDYSTGSSIMPQKRNPDVAELTRGKCGRVYGSLMSMLVVMKGLPLAYNRDMQEDKEGFLDASSTVSSSLSIMAAMLGHLHFNTQKMRQACGQGFLNATEFADYLVSKGIPFREAHHAAGKAVSMAEKRGVDLESLSLDDLKSISPVIEDDIYRWLPYEAAVQRRNAPGGTGPESVKAQLAELDKFVLRSQGG